MSRPAGPYAAVALVFAASRVVYGQVFGVRFDATPVWYYIQYINPWFMEHDLWRSLWYLHHQAPLQNALVGVPVHFLGTTAAFEIVRWAYAALGLATVLGLLHAMLRLGVQPAVAVVLTLLYTVSPTTVLYENWLLYHLPVTCCLVFALVALLRYLTRGTSGAALLFFSLLATTALLRSIFGPLFILLAAAPLVWRPPESAGRSARAALLRAAAVPLLLVSVVSLKPKVLLGYQYGEALLWCNLADKVYVELSAQQQDEVLASGAVSRAVQVLCMGDLRAFGDLKIPHAPTGVPLLDLERSPATGTWNAHALEYLLIARRYHEPDALYLVSHHPAAYARGVWRALSVLYPRSSTSIPMLPATSNYARLRRLDEAIKDAAGRGREDRLLALMIGLPLSAAYGVFILLRDRRRRPRPDAARAVGFILLTILYVTAVTVLVSSGDFNRYRYEIDPYYLVLFALLASDLTRWVAGARPGRASGPAAAPADRAAGRTRT